MNKFHFRQINFGLTLILYSCILFGQNEKPFYVNLSAIQEYRSNIYRVEDSLKTADSRINTYFRIGFQKSAPVSKQYLNIYYENQIKQYYNYQIYCRMEHVLFGNYHISPGKNTQINITDRFQFRDYSNSESLNYYRNILTFYIRQTLLNDWQISTGYRHWLKQYPANPIIRDYSSNRVFLTNTYDLDTKTRIGLKNEFSWHSGNLYPFDVSVNDTLNPIGTRYSVELFGRTIVRKKYFIDFRYTLETDRPEDFRNNEEGEYSGDEETEDILAEDSDFDYTKHKVSSSVLFKASERFSLFGFGVIQSKRFQHWMTENENQHRRDLLLYLSLNAKIELLKNLSMDFNYNLENNHSNLPSFQFSTSVIGIGLRYRF